MRKKFPPWSQNGIMSTQYFAAIGMSPKFSRVPSSRVWTVAAVPGSTPASSAVKKHYIKGRVYYVILLTSFLLTMESFSQRFYKSLLCVAELVEEGSVVVLSCTYLLEAGQSIDSVKWYLNTTEIYRIVPGLYAHR